MSPCRHRYGQAYGRHDVITATMHSPTSLEFAVNGQSQVTAQAPRGLHHGPLSFFILPGLKKKKNFPLALPLPLVPFYLGIGHGAAAARGVRWCPEVCHVFDLVFFIFFHFRVFCFVTNTTFPGCHHAPPEGCTPGQGGGLHRDVRQWRCQPRTRNGTTRGTPSRVRRAVLPAQMNHEERPRFVLPTVTSVRCSSLGSVWGCVWVDACIAT